jgi:hypothetical protein
MHFTANMETAQILPVITKLKLLIKFKGHLNAYLSSIRSSKMYFFPR